MTTEIGLTAELNKQREVLLGRVRKGNEVLFRLWCQAKGVADDKTAWSEAMEKIDQKFLLLDTLCRALMGLGYTVCLYEFREHKQCYSDTWFCFVCPKVSSLPGEVARPISDSLQVRELATPRPSPDADGKEVKANE